MMHYDDDDNGLDPETALDGGVANMTTTTSSAAARSSRVTLLSNTTGLLLAQQQQQRSHMSEVEGEPSRRRRQQQQQQRAQQQAMYSMDRYDIDDGDGDDGSLQRHLLFPANNTTGGLSPPPPSRQQARQQDSESNDNAATVQRRRRRRSLSEPELRGEVHNHHHHHRPGPLQSLSAAAATTTTALLRNRRSSKSNQRGRSRAFTADHRERQQDSPALPGDSCASLSRVVPTAPGTAATSSSPSLLSNRAPLSPLSRDSVRYAAVAAAAGSTELIPRIAFAPTAAATTSTTILHPATVLPPRPLSSNDTSVATTITEEEGPIIGSDERDDRLQARIRWVRINRRFQLVITAIALLFSLLLFGIMISWVVLTSAFVVSWDKPCDLPLKPYFWLVTLQLVLDVFRTDIMRFVFRWDSQSTERIPARVIVYNVAYLIYALLVMRMGIRSVVAPGATASTCKATAPDLYKASLAFVSLSIAAWATIICGYLLPFCVVAALLTLNGYNPSEDMHRHDDNDGMLHRSISTQPVFPSAFATSGAPPDCIDRLAVVPAHEFSHGIYAKECCICMEEFNRQDVAVEAKCRHIFHKPCMREWLRQARTCPVCRDDIPSTLQERRSCTSGTEGTGAASPAASIPLGPSGRPVAGLLRILRQASFGRTGRDTNARPPSSPPRASRTEETAGILSLEIETGSSQLAL
jgi:Ring finger domain